MKEHNSFYIAVLCIIKDKSLEGIIYSVVVISTYVSVLSCSVQSEDVHGPFDTISKHDQTRPMHEIMM